MTPRGLAVLDFSGTLSPAAARFGSWDRITDELRRSGLADIGIVDAGVFWERLVNPTWERGSTTDAGYARVLTQAAVAHLERGGDAVDRAAVATAVQRFADAYLVASAIAPAWRPWLRRLAALERTTVVAATDHYAEATTRIVDEIGTAGVPAIPLGAVPAAGAQPGEAGVLVANSADLGHHKQTRPFWDAVARTVGPVERIAVIDDFGANEPDADGSNASP